MRALFAYHRMADSVDRRALALCAVMASMTTWWLARAYGGFQHDALYYGADALRRSGLTNLDADLFFGAGTQGDYSVFSLAYSRLVGAIGLEASALISTLAARLAWLAALSFLCVAALSKTRALFAIVLVLTLSPFYDAHRLLSYAEPFATPRHWAEAVSLGAVAFSLRGRWKVAAAFATLACALHPLMGFGTFAVVVACVPQRPRHAIALFGVISMLYLVLSRTGSFGRLVEVYDPTWFNVVRRRNVMVLFNEWDADGRAHGGLMVLLVFAGWQHASSRPALRRLLGAMTFVGVILVALWIFGTFTRSVLLIQLQPWRVLWLIQVTAMIAMASLLPSRMSSAADHFFVALLCSALLLNVWSGLLLGAVSLTTRLEWIQWPSQRRHQVWLAFAAWVALASVVIFRMARLDLNIIAYDVAMSDPMPRLTGFANEPLVTGAVALVITSIVCSVGVARFRYFAICLGWCLPMAAMSFWVLNACRLFASEQGGRDVVLMRQLPPGQTVFWDAGVEATWLRLGRAHYASEEQGAGALFSRPAALELQRRMARLDAANLFNGEGRLSSSNAGGEAASRADIRWLCEDPVLDLVLLSGRRQQASQWVEGASGAIVSVFNCSAIRALSTSVATWR